MASPNKFCLFFQDQFRTHNAENYWQSRKTRLLTFKFGVPDEVYGILFGMKNRAIHHHLASHIFLVGLKEDKIGRCIITFILRNNYIIR